MALFTTDGLVSKYLYVFFVVSLYWFVSIVTVFINKTLFSTSSLDAPLFITWYQSIISVFICILLNKTFPESHTFPNNSYFDWNVGSKIFPLAVLFTGMVTFNNLCLKYVAVSFYYIGRSLTTVFNVIFTYLILGQKTSLQTLLCCFIIIGGFWLGVDQENLAGSLSIRGTIFGVTGSLLLSLYSIHTKHVLQFVNQQVWLLSYYNNLFSCVLYLPCIALNQEIQSIIQYDGLFEPVFWALMTLGGLCGFSIGFVTALQIQATSPLTHNVSGTAKACAQTVLASYWYNETKSALWWLSNWIVICGSAGYTYVKHKEMEQQHKELNPNEKITIAIKR